MRLANVIANGLNLTYWIMVMMAGWNGGNKFHYSDSTMFTANY